VTSTAEQHERRVQLVTPDLAATRYLYAAAAWLAVGTILWTGAMAAISFPALLPISYGRLRPMALIALGLGWLVMGLSAAWFYLLPRLTATPLPLERPLNRFLLPANLIAAGGIVIVGLGWGDGREPFALPWWWDLPVLALTALALGPTALSLRHRLEGLAYPSLWFGAAGAVWLPVIYVAANLPGLSSLADALADFMFSSAFINVWAIGLANAAAYYVVPKVARQPLPSRQLARVGFWSLLVGGVWTGAVQLAGGPQPDWLGAVAAVLGLALPVSALANSTNLMLAIGPRWQSIKEEPILLAAALGSAVITLAALLGAIAGFRSASVMVSFTLFWEGLLTLQVAGLALLFAAFAWQAVPNLVGRKVTAVAAVPRRLLGGGMVAGLFLVLAGVITGASWAGAGFTGAFDPIGGGWGAGIGAAGIFTGLGVLAFLYLAWGLLGLAISIYRAFTSGTATEQEVLVVREP